MKLNIAHKDKILTFETSLVKDISIALNFNGDQPSLYQVSKAVSRPYEENAFIGDTRKGGACNFETIKLVPHCNGTHTECIGHITHDRYSIHRQLQDSLILATLITIAPVDAMASNDSYVPEKESNDRLISKKILKDALRSVSKDFLKALVIRTLPNDKSKMKRDYAQKNPAFFSIEAMKYLVESGVEHLLVDLPSIDRNRDEGKLKAHHLFWNIKPGDYEADSNSFTHKTITEMIYVDEDIDDGSYLLNLQIAPFMSDASPSRPLLYPLIDINK